MNDWPTKLAAKPMLEKSIAAINERISNLKTESTNAQKRNEGAVIASTYKQLQEILTTVEDIKARLSANGNLDVADVKALGNHREAILQSNIELKAQKLEAEIFSKADVTIQTAQGITAAENITLTAGEIKKLMPREGYHLNGTE